MSRRGENIYKRKDGRWEARYPKERTGDGRILYGSVYAASYTEVKNKRNEVMSAYQSDMVRDKRTSIEVKLLCDLAEEWLREKRTVVKESTYVRYRHLYEKHINPTFGKETLDSVDFQMIENHIRMLERTAERDGLAPKTVQDILSVYHLLVEYGVYREYISPQYFQKIKTSHLSANAKLPVLLPHERCILEKYVLKNGDVRSLGIVIAMYTGLRIGELCALRWKDIDLKNGLMTINTTVQRLHDYGAEAQSKTKVCISDPKTPSSYRTIPLTTFLIEELRKHISEPENYILTDTVTPEEPRSYLYFYKRQLELCKIPEYTFHAIRHTFATRCVEEGVDIKSLSEILGHSNVKITMNRYVHPSLESKRRQMEKLVVTV